MATVCPQTIPFAQARGTIYEGNLLLSVMIEQTIIQAALSSIETFDGTKSKFEAWTESIENAEYISKSLSPLEVQVIIVPKNPDPFNAQKQRLFSSLRLQVTQ